MRPTSRSAFKVAIFCALVLEADAVEALFDEVYDRLGAYYGKEPGDTNTYITGRIGDHDIVLCCMPEMGKRSAASSAAALHVSYSQVQLALLVGVCGAAPYAADGSLIFRGDIIISDAVVEYDLGKQYPGGFQRKTNVKDTLGRPPREIRSFLTALSGRQTRFEFQQKTIQHLDAIGRLGTLWQRPKKLDDNLFHASYHHKHSSDVSGASCRCSCAISPDDICSAAMSQTCDDVGCDKKQIYRQRASMEPIKPLIHIGPIACADTVMKSGEHRDRLVKSDGIIGFEMEGTGVWDNIPCIVIKGVCDYADSHKDKAWQSYAAAAGASAAKTLLQLWRNTSNREGHHCWLVPFQRNPKFVGRDSELTKLQEFIRELHGTKKLAIVGLGGVGKTQIAVEVAYCIRELHTNYSVFWIPCISYGMVEQAFMDIATMLQIPDIDPAKVKDQVKSCLSQHCPRKWLLIFDNADNMDMWVGSNTTFPPLRHFLPESQQGRILFTTRNHKLAVKLVGSNTISVPELDEKAGFDLLQRSLLRNPQLGGTEVQKKLLQRLTYLPLAIVQATAYINQNLVDLPTYMELLDEKEPDVVELLCEDFDDDWRYMDAQNPVITTWWLSFQQIQQLDLLAFDYLLFTGCIDPRNIPQTLFPPAASKKKAIDAIGLLKAFSFLSEREEMTFDMHQLVYLAIRTWLRKTKMFSKMIAAVASRLKDVLPNNGEGSRTLWRAYLPHALSMIHNEEFENQQSLFLDLLERIGGCLVDDGRYNEAETIFGNIVATRQREGNEPNESTLANMRALASIYWNQSKWKEAESLQLQTLETSRRVLGPNARIVLTTMTELANTLASQGRLKEAEELTQEAINSHESILGAHDKGTLACKACLASIHFEQEQYDKALKLLLELKESSLNELGSAHEANLTNLNNLACVYEQKGELEKAEDIYLQVLESKERIIGLAHPRTLTTMINLASLYHNKGGKSEKAEELLSQVVTMSESTLGPRHRLTLVSRNNLASSFLSRGQLKEAEPLLLQVLEIRRQDFGPSDPQTLESMKAVASLYGRQTEWEKEAEIRVQLVEGLKKMLGPKRPKTLQSMDALMVTYMNLKRWDEAETLGLRILETLKELPLSERPALTTSMYNLAFTYLEQGKLIEAGNQFVELMRWQNEILEPGAPETLRSMRGLALVYQGLERWQEAESLLIDVLRINTGCHGKDHVMTRGSMLNLVVLWKLMGKERDALLLLEECERLSRKKEKE